MAYPNLPSAAVNPALVGRDTELAFLQQRLEMGLAGRGAVVALAGETGAGKTRLMDAVAGEAEKRRLRCWRSAADPARADMACGLFLEVLRAFLEQGPRLQRQALRRSIEELAPHLQGALFPQGRRRRQGPAGMPLQWRLNLFCARLARQLLEVAQQRPLVLCLEDLHWADATSLQLLRHLGRKNAAVPLVILCTYRLEEVAPDLAGTVQALWGNRHFELLKLGRLSPAQTRALVGSCLARAELGEDLFERLQHCSEGVPLFVLQYLELLAEQGILRESERTWVDQQVESWGVPDGVRQALWLRARGLSPAEQRVLSYAAVQGVEFKGELVAQALGWPLTQALRILGNLARTTCLITSGERGFRFAHALLREFFCELLAQPEQRALHLQLAYALERRGEAAAVLAHHFSQAGAASLALSHFLKAAGWARASSAYREAQYFLRRAIEGMGQTARRDGGAEDRARHLKVVLELAEVDERLGAWNQVEEGGFEALRLWGPEAARAVLGRALLQLGKARGAKGEWEQAGKLCREALDCFAESGEERAGTWVHLELGSIALERTLLEEARAHLAEARAWAVRRNDGALLGEACRQLGQLSLLGGRYLEAMLRGTEALRACRKAEDKYGLCQTHRFLGELLAAQGESWAALECFLQSEVLARQMGASGLLARALLDQARVLAGIGAEEVAESQCLAARVHLDRTGDRRGRAEGHKVEGIVCRERARAGGAATELYAAAADRLQQGRHAFQELGNRFEEAECAVELGLLLQELGDGEGARRRWGEASELFSRIGAAGGRRRAEELLAVSAA